MGSAKTSLTQAENRRAFSVIAVLAILSVAVVMTYAMLKAEVTSLHLTRNSNRAEAARQAAYSGLNMAIRRMHHATEWGGVSSVYNQSLSSTESFTATYTAGDPNLTPTAPDWEDYPYRVTIDVQGISIDPMFSGNVATVSLRAVVRLVPVAMPAELTNWNAVLQHTIYQTTDGDFKVELPLQIEGSVRLQGELKIADKEPDDEDARNEYLDDLNNAQLGGEPDYRPFLAPVSLPLAGQDVDMLNDLTVRLGVTAIDIPEVSMPPDWDDQPKKDDFSTYQIYAGGPVYSVEFLVDNVASASSDPLTNPLGLFAKSGNLTLDDDVLIRGTLIVDHELKLDGTNIDIRPVDLPALAGTTEAVRLPSVLAKKLTVEGDASGALTGFVVLWEEFKAKAGTYPSIFDFAGHLVLEKFDVEESDQWKNFHWSLWHSLFVLANIQTGPNQYFPIAMGNPPAYLSPIPTITFKPDTQPARYHWKSPDPNQPVFVPRSEDDGLFWETLSVEVQP
ncbi:MAG: hypothetical protein RJP95_00630 [Pirellulales bacterium]